MKIYATSAMLLPLPFRKWQDILARAICNAMELSGVISTDIGASILVKL